MSLEELARKCLARHDYDQVIQIVERIPEKKRNAGLVALAGESRGKADEISFLICEIDEAVRLNDRQTALKKADELLKIKPGHHRALEVQEEFAGYGKGARRRLGPLRQFTQPWNEGGWIPWSVLAFGLAVFGVMTAVMAVPPNRQKKNADRHPGGEGPVQVATVGRRFPRRRPARSSKRLPSAGRAGIAINSLRPAGDKDQAVCCQREPPKPAQARYGRGCRSNTCRQPRWPSPSRTISADSGFRQRQSEGRQAKGEEVAAKAAVKAEVKHKVVVKETPGRVKTNRLPSPRWALRPCPQCPARPVSGSCRSLFLPPKASGAPVKFFGRPVEVRGDWMIENDELVQPTLAGIIPPHVTFGNPGLSTYDLTVEVKKTGGSGAMGIFFHSLGDNHYRAFSLEENRRIGLFRGFLLAEKSYRKEFPYVSNRWYSLRIEARGDNVSSLSGRRVAV